MFRVKFVFSKIICLYEEIESTACLKRTHIHLPAYAFSPLRAGVGNALEGGRGRTGTKLFQDFQMLSRIWTHPWCLQLDYISKENRVRLEKKRLNHTRNTWIQITHTVGKSVVMYRWQIRPCYSSRTSVLRIICATNDPAVDPVWTTHCV